MSFDDGSCYQGQWRNNQMHGQGELSRRNGRVVYRGDFKHNLRHGQGAEHDGTTGKVTYEGEFWNNARNGRGVAYFSDGGRYDGTWSDGAENGRGTLYGSDGAMLYQGQWRCGREHGYGVEYLDGGDVRYDGQWEKGVWNGKGVLYRLNGSRLEGRWVRGMLQGWAMVYLPDGDKYGGRFHRGVLQGPVTYHVSEGGSAWRRGNLGGWSIFNGVRKSMAEAEGLRLEARSRRRDLLDGSLNTESEMDINSRATAPKIGARGWTSMNTQTHAESADETDKTTEADLAASGDISEVPAGDSDGDGENDGALAQDVADAPVASPEINVEVSASAEEQEEVATSDEEVVLVNMMQSEIPAETDVAAPAPAVPAGTYVATGGTDLETAAMGAGSQGQQTGSDGESSVFVNSFAPLDPRAEEAAEEDAAPAAPATQPLEEPAEVREERQQDAAAAVANAAPATTPAESAVDSEALAERKRMAEESFAPLFWDDEEIDIPARPKPAEGAAVGAAADTEAEAQLTQEAPVELPIDEPAGLSREESTELPTKKATQVPKEECLAEVPKEEAAAPTELTKDEPAPGAAPTGVREREPSAVLAARLEEQLEYESGNVMAPLLAPRQRRGGGKTVRRWGLKVAARLGSIQEILKGTPLRERLKAELINDRLKAELINDKRRVK
uniref:Uncharacterized protein n=1 Tax=Phaeomonas parva TaxID=124430 RepID=A0A7S1TNM0_9STRA